MNGGSPYKNLTDVGLKSYTQLRNTVVRGYSNLGWIETALGLLLDPRNRDVLDAIVQGRIEDVPLRTVMFDPTHFCPFRCPGCIESKAMKTSGWSEFSLEQAKKILYQLRHESVEGLGFYGGEPTSHPYFSSILEYALKQGFQQLRIVTNGYYNNSVKDVMIDGKDVIECRISLNAAKEETHTRLHHPPNPYFDEIVRGIEDIASAGVRTGVSFLVDEPNHEEIFDSAYISKESGCSYFAVRPKTHLHGEGLIPLYEETRLDVLYQVNKAKNVLMDENFRVEVPGWYIHYLESGESPQTDKSYDRCLVSIFRITISPPEPGSVAMCAYRRGIDHFTSDLYCSLADWVKTERIKVFNRINPSRDCANVICNRDDMNRALHMLVQKQKDGIDVLTILRTYEFKHPFML